MAGANNAQFKAHGHTISNIAIARARYGKLNMKQLDRFAKHNARVLEKSTLARRAAAETAARKTPRVDLQHADVDAFSRHITTVAKSLRERRDGDKVFISHLYDALERRGDTHNMSLDAFKARLVEAQKRGTVRLARADLVEDMDPKVVARSESRRLSATLHLVRVD